VSDEDGLGQSFNTVRERLRDRYREAKAKAGDQRMELDVTVCWGFWLSWILDGWSRKQLAVGIDATNLSDRFVVLTVSILYRGCAVPVEGKVLREQQKHPWKPEWLALLQAFKARVPADWTIIVSADRGLYAKWLFQGIVELGWHPFLRVNVGGSFRPEGERLSQPFKVLVPAVGMRWQGRGTAFQWFEKSFTLHLVGLLERRPSRSLVDLDRSATRMCRCLLVWLAHLDRTGI